MDPKVKDKLHNFFSQYTPVSYKKGDMLIPGNQPQGVFYLKQGYVKQYLVSQSGEELLLNIYKPDTFFPSTWSIANIPNKHFFEAITLVKLQRAPKEAFQTFIKSNSDVLLDLTTRLLIGLSATLERLELIHLSDAHKKVAHTILVCAHRFGEPSGSNIVVSLNLKQETLASIAGISKETLSREMSKLKKAGIVDYQGSLLLINNIKSLENQITEDY